MRVGLNSAATVRHEVASFVDALVDVYALCIIGWIVLSFLFSLGVRVPYTRWSNAVLDFLRDVSEPYLRIFRPLPLRIGPVDLTPIVAILVLQVVGGIVVGLIDDAPR